MLSIYLLGTPVVKMDGQLLRVQRRLLRSLLFYLACQPDRCGRIDLATLLWPDRPEEEGLRLLRETLSKLRAQFPEENILLTDQDWVQLNPALVYSDVLEFGELVSQTTRLIGQVPASTPLPEAVLQKMIRAMKLWRGPRFLAGARLPESDMLNSWLTNFSHELDAQRQRMLERLVDHHLASGDPESAMQQLRLALTGDETNEGLQFRLINLFRRQQRFTEAINHFAYLNRLFQLEGYKELPPGLASLYRKLREEAVEAPDNQQPARWPVLAGMQAPFVGRQEILRELQMAYHRGSALIVFGEAGAGKSRLAQELYFALKPTPRLLLSAAHPGEQSLPLQPVIEMLRRSIVSEEWAAMDPAWLAPLAGLMPELPLLQPAVRPGPASNRVDTLGLNGPHLALLFEAIQRLLLSLARRQRLLMVIDDAQWCDSLTLAALTYWMDHRLFVDNGALLLIARREELSPAMRDFLNQPQRAFQQIILPPLSEPEAAALVRFIMGADYPNLTQRLQRATGGNPFYLLESLRALFNWSLDPQLVETIDYLPLTGSIHALIRARLQQLPPDAQQVLNAAAIFESDFSIDLLSAVTHLTGDQVLQAMDALEGWNLLKAGSRDLPSGGYAFVHEQIREVVLLNLTPARKRLMHQRAAQALEKSFGGQNSALSQLLASHYEAAGDLKKAFGYWLAVAQVEHQVRPGNAAQAALERAESLLERMKPLTVDEDVYNLYHQWGQMAYDRADANAQQYAYNRMLEVGHAHHNALLVGNAYNGLTQRAMLLLDADQGLQLVEKAIMYLEQANARQELAEAYNRAGMFYIFLDQYHRTLEVFQKALPLYPGTTDQREIAARLTTYHQMALVESLIGDPHAAILHSQLAHQNAERIMDHSNIARALVMLGVSTMFAGRYQESMVYIRTAQPLVEASQSSQSLAYLTILRSYVTFALGQLDESWQAAQTGLALAQQANDYFIMVDANIRLGDLHLFKGEIELARQFYQTGSQIGPHNFHHYDALFHLALALSGLGQVDEAMLHIQAARNYFAQAGLRWYWRIATLAEAYIRFENGHIDQVDELIERAIQDYELYELRLIAARGLALRARLALHSGQPEKARTDAQAAIDLAKEMQFIPLLKEFERSLCPCFGNGKEVK